MERLLWFVLVLILTILASVAGSFVAWLIKGHTKADRAYQTRNAPKGAAAVIFWVFAGLGCGLLMCMVSTALVMILVRPFDDPPPGPGVVHPPRDPPHVDAPPHPPKPAPAEDMGPKDKQTPMLAGTVGSPFKDEAPPGALLIGFDVGVGQAFGVELVKSIQPWYRSPQGEFPGRKFGTDFAKVRSVRARPGFAVGAIEGKAGLVVNGFSVIYMHVQGDKLDPKDFYSSSWIGDRTGGSGPTRLGGDGTPIIGIIGTRNHEDCTGLGLLKR